MTPRFWTPEESTRLGFVWANTEITAGQIAALLRRTERAVFRRAQKLGLPPRRTRWTPERLAQIGRAKAKLEKPKPAPQSAAAGSPFDDPIDDLAFGEVRG